MCARRTAVNASIIQNTELLNDKIHPEVYMQEPWRLYDSILYKWVPYHYGEERDKRGYQYGDKMKAKGTLLGSSDTISRIGEQNMKWMVKQRIAHLRKY